MSFFFRYVGVSLLLCVSAASQTYAPKTLRFEGVPASDTPQLLQMSGLKPGASVTKEQLEAGLQAIADSGAYTDISYTVSPAALVITLTPAAGAQSQKVRFANFVWWTPEELERLVEAKVPLFHGELPLKGSLTDQVEAALVELCKTKGVDATISVAKSSGGFTLQIDHPEILFGDLAVDSQVKPVAGATMEEMKRGLHGSEFDVDLTRTGIVGDTTDIYKNAGYLAVKVDDPVFTAPKLVAGRYVLDATVAVDRGPLYKVAKVGFAEPPPLFPPGDLRNHVTLVEEGYPASPMALHIAEHELTKPYDEKGYLDCAVTTATDRDDLKHEVAYSFTIQSGEIYHVGSADTSALPADVQSTLKNDKRLQPGAVAGSMVITAVLSAAKEAGERDHKKVSVAQTLDHKAKTVDYVFGWKDAKR